MRRQARKIATWGENVYVKIPVTHDRAASRWPPLVRELSEDGVQVNVTALFTTAQVELITEALSRTARRAASRSSPGASPTPASTRCRSWRARSTSCRARPRAELIWASPREVLNLVQADQIGCHIITDDPRPAAQGQRASARTSSSSRSRRSRCSTATRVAAGLHALNPRVQRALVTGGAGFIGSTLADRLLGRRRRGRRSSTTSAPAAASSSSGALGTRRASCSRATSSTATVLSAAMEGCDIVFHLQANADVRYGLEHPQPRPRAEHDRNSNVLEAMRAARRAPDRASPRPARSTASPRCSRRPRTRRSRSRRRCTRASKARRRGDDRRLRRRLRLHRRDLPLRLDAGRALHARPRHRLLPRRSSADPSRLRVLGDGKQQQELPVRRRLRRRACSPPRRHGRGRLRTSTTSGTDETVVVDGSVATHHRPHGPRSPRSTYTGGKRGWAGDSPLIHLDTRRSARSAGRRR